MQHLDPNFYFKISHQDPKSKARCGILSTPHGALETPAFIFCATKAALKGVMPEQAEAANTQIILANTYHLMLQPGADLVAQQGGLHKFMGWNGPMLTDSGGFQIFSLGHGSVAEEIKGKRSHAGNRSKTLLKITEEGAKFRSYIDGKIHHLTPELAIEIQNKLGADFILVLDECTPFHVSKEYTRKSMQLSHRWAQRSYDHYRHLNIQKQALYGIVQGGVYSDLRQESAAFINGIDFFGQAIGGSLGADKNQMHDIVIETRGYLNNNRPTHLLGIGGLSDIVAGVKAGIDTFDCVHPTRLARHGGALVSDRGDRE
ncbi:MAG: tRNA guanosine(34) transglycosylase Tgt, partial [Gammaproteobacteria bacterium]